MNRTRGKIVGFMLVTGMVLLTACSEKESGKDAEKKEPVTAVSQFEDVAGEVWNDTWKIEEENGGVINVKMNGLVTVPYVKEMSVVEVEKFAINKNNKKRILDNLFDGGTVYYYDSENRKRGNQVKQENYEENCYLGERGGILYVLSFEEQKDAHSSGINIYMEAYNSDDVVPDKLQGEKNVFSYEQNYRGKEKNECLLSEKEASEMARKYLEEIGFSDWIPTNKGELVWESEGGKKLFNGYRFWYSPGIDGNSFSSFGCESAPYSVDGIEFYSETAPNNEYGRNCSIELEITDRGIVHFSIQNPITITSVTKGVKMLPFKTVQNIIKTQTGEFAKNIYDKYQMSPNFKGMDLVYYRMADPENENLFAYIPAWRLNEYNGNAFVVNAMDGSIIEEWNIIWALE